MVSFHWLTVLKQVTYKLCIMAHSCLHGPVPQYLVDLCLPVSNVASRHHLRYASRRLLVLQRHHEPGMHCLTILEFLMFHTSGTCTPLFRQGIPYPHFSKSEGFAVICCQSDCLHGLRTSLRYVLVHPLSFF